jgi:predicted acetyltransferase
MIERLIYKLFIEVNSMTDFKLIYPSKEYEKSAFEYIQEFLEYNSQINGTGGLDRYDNYDEWLLKLEKDLDIPNIPEGRVPANTYFLIRTSDNIIIGMINIRHKLNDFLLNEGGHIGYSIRPTERNKGYGTLMLKLGLEKCRELKLNKVLISCDKTNIGSARVIQNNNGILENEAYSKTFSAVIQRYWINL